MSLAVAWLLFPLLLLVVSLGAGAVVDFLSGGRLAGVLLIPAGLALLVVVTRLLTYWEATAPLATPAVLALTALGLALLAAGARPLGPDPWAVATFAAVFAVFAAPVLLSGEATFAGYGLLGDTSVHLTIIDQIMSNGRDLSDLPPSSYRSALEAYVDSSYPTGAHGLLGAMRPLTGQDVAWLFQPFLAFLAATAALSLYSIAGAVVESRRLRFAASLIAAQPALVLAYSLQGSIKEIAAVALLPLLIALAPALLREDKGRRRLIAPALAGAALLCVLGPAALAWVVPAMALFAVLIWIGGRERPGAALGQVALLGGMVALFALPVVLGAESFFRVAGDVLTSQTEVGNLVHPLNELQVFGVWLTGDYRLTPAGFDLAATRFLIAIAALLTVAGVVMMARDRTWLPLSLLGVSVAGAVVATLKGSPWADAKALMVCSSAVLLTATLAVALLFDRGRLIVATLAGCALLAGVVWSNALAYHEAKLAPRDRLVELGEVGESTAGEGPTLYTEFEEFGKHFLRENNPTGWSESWHPPGPGGRFEFTEDLDQVPIDQQLRYSTIVLRRSPVDSRPPAGYQLSQSGRWYSVWQRAVRAPEVLEHHPLGSELSAAAEPDRADLRRLAARAEARDARLAYFEPATVSVAPIASARRPARWAVDRQDPQSLRPAGPGVIVTRLDIARSGPYTIWLRGSVGRNLTVEIDGRSVGTLGPRLSGRNVYERVGAMRLAKGARRVEIDRGRGDLRPGSGAQGLIGPLVAIETRKQQAVSYLAASDWRRLLGRKLDWVEVVRR